MKNRMFTRFSDRRLDVYVDRVWGGVTMLAVHEAEALRGHLAAAEVRLRVARRARGLGELLRNQIDLLPESRKRWRNDHAVRRRLWREFVRDLREPTPPSAG